MQRFSGEFQDLEQQMYAVNFVKQNDAEAIIRHQEAEQRRDFLRNLAAETWIQEMMPLVVSSFPEKYGPPESKYDGRSYKVKILLYESEGQYLVSSERGRSIDYVGHNNQHLEPITAEVNYSDDLLLPTVTEYIKANACESYLPPVIADPGVKLLRLPYVKPDLRGHGRQPQDGIYYLAGRPRSWRELLPDFLGIHWYKRLPYERHNYDQTWLFQDGKWQRVIHWRSSENYGLSKSRGADWPSDRLELEKATES